ncbi:bifunctional 3-(3-hydroxy-phenyl)propionate/3-hydroxycinnamic acid hydroxylase [Paracoccus versutus]|uniref:bifunctional 3-(3-hydroxy-phenyl)propionate/3-hydroxycinnamic acid hydroxylase n=1 Tax=Paracoccus versutus TaxID=34007 RepID=UPI000DF7D677|nr:bifunctional 3-(3-hydroxy-phenyl)propionate/3-hydroxycinnamic acid hydroxylase [Paracoccus versutus]RDD69853.1 bifunctional 3-(3-hydroxy-phenyl)propionate/3-hydroxycinnamic acid hydroxylase [Paracoccus versutus]
MNDHQVIVIGAGPTGLTTACLLAAYGVPVLVLERNAAPLDIPRAIIADDEGMRTFQSFGLVGDYGPGAMPSEGARYYDDSGNCFAVTGTGTPAYGFPRRIYINQPDLETVLRRRAAELGVELRFSSEVTELEQREGDILVTVRDAEGGLHRIATQYVAACDGGRSPVRERLGIALQGSTYAQDWIVIDTRNDPDESRFTRFFCSDQRPGASIPAPNGGRRYEFMLLPGETHDEVLAPAMVRELVAPHRALDEADIIRKTIYTFHARIAERFREGRILLMGDAAHLTPPFAGQGMNAGLRDAANVAWKLAAVVRGGASPAILDSYFDERRDPAWAMIQLAVAMGDIIMPLGSAGRDFRQMLLERLAPFPAVRDYLMQMRFKPRPRHPRGLFLDLDDQPFEGAIVGEMIPQPMVEGPQGSIRLDEALGPGFALIAQDRAGAAALAACPDTTLAGLPLGRASLGFDAPAPAAAGVPALRVTETAVGRPLRTHRDQVLLVRPDRYAAAAFSPKALEAGLAAYARLLGS